MQHHTPLRVLVIDDEEALTRAMKLNLESTGRYEVHTINDSHRALATALRVLPDLILLDLMMPGMDGGDVADALQGCAQLADTPVVFLTALVRKAEQEDLQLGGKIKYGLGKPVSLEEIDQLVRNIFETADAH